MPLKIAGIAISVIEASSVASGTPSVVFESAIHLSLPRGGYAAVHAGATAAEAGTAVVSCERATRPTLAT